MKPQAQPGDLPLVGCADEDQAVTFDFVVAYFDDLDAGRQQRLADYLTRFPGHESIIAAEYLRQEYLRGDRIPAEAGAGISDEEGDASESVGEQRLGPYRLLRELGRGGQGSVWLAADTRIQRRVALKLLSGFFITDDRRKRLRREAESVARLAHPGICSVLEAEVEGEQPYIAMQYVPGQDLAASLNAAQAARAQGEEPEGLPWVPADRHEQSRCLHFFERAARALHAAHEADLVHRDIKPGNLIVTPDGEPVLLDFGLAQDLQSVDGLTRSEDLLGTPHYMSPEQLRGEHDETDRRADVYALGVSLFECLAGRRPFEGESRFVLQNSILMDVLPDPREFNAALDRDVVAVLETALERDPARRYSSALDFAEDLRRIREFEPVHARPAGVPLRLARWARRQPAVAAATCVTLLSLSIGLGVTLNLLAENRRALDRAHGRQFTTRARELTESNPDLSLLLGMEAAHRLDDHLGRSVLFGPLETCQLRRVLDRPMALRFWHLARAGSGQVLGAMTVAGENGQPFTGTLERWDLKSGERRQLFEVSGTAVRIFAVQPGDKALVLGTDDGRLVGLDLESEARTFERQPGATARGAQRAVIWIEFAPSGTEFAVQLACGETLRYRYPQGELISRWSGPPLSASLVSYSPDGSRLLISGATFDAPNPCSDSTARIVDVLRGNELARLDHGGASGSTVNWAGWSPSGDSVATVGADGRALIWSASGETLGQLIGAPRLHGGSVTCAAFSPDGQVLATGTHEDSASRVVLWPLGGGAPAQILEGHLDSLSGLAWSPDGERLASVSLDQTVRLWSRSRGELIKTCRAQTIPIQVLWTRDGDSLVSCTRGYRAHVWNVGPMPHVYRLRGHEGPVRWASFLRGGRRAVTAGADGTVRLWSTPPGSDPSAWSESGRALKQAELHSEGIQRARLGGEQDQLLLTAGLNGGVRLFDLQAWAPLGRMRTFEAGVRDMIVCPQIPVVAVLDQAGRLVWFDPSSGDAAQEWACPGSGTIWTHLALEPGGTRLAATSDGGVLGLLDLADAGTTRTLDWAPESEVDRLGRAENPGGRADGGQLALLGRRAEDLAWRLDGEELALLDGVQRLWSFSPSGEPVLGGIPFAHHRLLWTGRERIVLGWDQRFGLRTLFHDLDRGSTFKGSLARGAVTLTSTSPEGKWLAAVGSDGRVDILNGLDGEIYCTNELHEGAVHWVAFSPDAQERRVLSAGEDGSVLVWPVDPMSAARARQPRPLGFLEKQNEWTLAEGR